VDPAALTDASASARAAAIAQVRYKDLKDPAVLRRVLRACRDGAVVGGDALVGDPFEAFFGAAGGAGRTVGDHAADRLEKTGLPPDRATVDLLAEALAEDGPPGRLPAVVAGALGETGWDDLDHAVRTLVPALDPFDQPLFQAIVRLPSTATPALIDLALRPLRPRLFQELMNHAPSREELVKAVVPAMEGADERALATVAAVLAAWSDPAAGKLARAHEGRHRWLLAIRAIDDPTARPELGAWLAGPREAPEGWLARVTEILRPRERLDGWPTAAWLRATGDDVSLAEAWGVDQPGVAEVLVERVRQTGDWAAILLLVGAQRHAPILDRIDPRSAPWSEAALTALAEADPPVPGLAEALLDHLRADPSDVASAAEALIRLGAGSAATDLVLDAAARAPERTAPAGRGLVRVFREGVDLEGLEPLVPADRADRYEELRPFVRAE
jgi:hypothetical protein